MNEQADIVERLEAEPSWPGHALEAASEITRLRGIVAAIKRVKRYHLGDSDIGPWLEESKDGDLIEYRDLEAILNG